MTSGRLAGGMADTSTIAIIGTGKVGQSLARACLHASHSVVFGSRDPESERVARVLRDLGPGARALRIPEAVAAGEIVVLAVPWEGVPVALAAADEALQDKILIDATNPLEWEQDHAHHVASPSAGEMVQELATGARVVKAFNTLGYEQISDPIFGEHHADLLIAADDEQAKAIVEEFGASLGLRPLDAGPLRNAAVMERLAMLWLALASNGMGRDITFKVLER